MSKLKDKVAIITGAGAGMGRATALLFAEEGAKVAVTDVDVDGGKETVEKITEAGGEAKFWELDVSDESNVKDVIDKVASEYGQLDILINNAGLTGADKETHEVTEEEWDEVFDVDVKGVFFMTKHAYPHLKKSGKAAIVNFSSILGLVGSPDLAPYTAAKGAVTLMTKKDAVTYGRDGIRVNSVHPGTILTPLVKQLADAEEGYEERMLKQHPIGYLGEPEDVAYAVLFLASDEARFITGASLTVDGGYTAQ